jgi:ABC-2 type transport system permease protein
VVEREYQRLAGEAGDGGGAVAPVGSPVDLAVSAAAGGGLALARWQRTPRASLGLYIGFIRLAFLKFLAYRLRYYTGVVSYTVFIAGNYYIYSALFASSTAAGARIGGLTLHEMITYVAISWIGRSFYFDNIDRTLAGQIREGQIAVQLIKPFHVQTVMFFEALGEAGFRLLMFTLPITIVILPLFKILAPASPALYGWTLLSFILALLVNSQINFLLGCLAFYLKNITGVIRAKMVTMEFLTGVLIPFTFFPEWFQKLVTFLPFQAVSYVPVTIYLGRRTGEELAAALLLQAAWGLGLFVLGRLFWSYSVRHVTLQGG